MKNEVNGFLVRESSGGGKAGKGRNKTGSVQLVEPINNGFLIRKYFTFKKGDFESYLAAYDKAVCFALDLDKFFKNMNFKTD